MEYGLPHPGDASRFVPLPDLLTEMHGALKAAAAMLDAQGQTILDHEVLFQVQGQALEVQRTTIDAQAAALANLTTRLAKVETDPRVAELTATVSSLSKQIATLEGRLRLLEGGPAYGVDISGHQNTTVTQAVVDDPVNAFVIVKATEGMGGKNDAYAAQRAAAGAKFLGAYHFAWLNQDPLKEAANFLTVAALKPGEVAFLDVENWGTGTKPTPEMQATSWAQRLAFTLAWLDEVKAKSGATPAVYANWDWIRNLRTAATSAQWARLVTYPLWLAEWTNVAGKHSTVTGKDGTDEDSWPIVLHQYGVIDNLDRNWTPDIAALRGLGVK